MFMSYWIPMFAPAVHTKTSSSICESVGQKLSLYPTPLLNLFLHLIPHFSYHHSNSIAPLLPTLL